MYMFDMVQFGAQTLTKWRSFTFSVPKLAQMAEFSVLLFSVQQFCTPRSVTSSSPSLGFQPSAL